ncbi:YeeE/YedE family protein [Undibacterium cyanobacteriorum]|uniref:YeeE/YedE family protein n=1 Tax=Undibacterium cyanobacteriorum TaxID=3073561 RepID=A0ABY9RGD1_9BURK|nr:YeeE/YedE family protein [Undibacterium sp. 20NA77.5]WMW79695.1 YeeE/YedE family protein [Undibacterium sp. 20NA77.5]
MLQIDWTHFTPVSALIGGLCIGLASILLMAYLGRIAGITGIIAEACKAPYRASTWRYAFMLGLALAAPIYAWFLPALPFLPLENVSLDISWTQCIIAGLIVGFGSRLGSGCTSGHGVCGISRGSLRSIVATVLFMTSAFITVFVLRHLLHLS